MNIEEIKNKILPILRRYRVEKAGVFGSVVRGEEREDGDIDILLELPKGLSLLDLVGIKLELEEILLRRVDVLTYNSIYYLLRESILSEEIRIL